MLFMHLDPVFTLPAWIAQSPMHLTPKKMTASGHTHGFFVPQFMATWLVPANIQPLNIYWILEKGASLRQEECLAVAETITCTCSELSGTEPRTILVKGFVRGHEKLGSAR